MTLCKFITNLIDLEAEDPENGSLEVHAMVGSSGVAYELGSCVRRTKEDVDSDTGLPEVNGDWIQICAGN